MKHINLSNFKGSISEWTILNYVKGGLADEYADIANVKGNYVKKSENLLVLTNTAVRREGVTFTTNIDGSVKLNGTATNNQYSCFTTLYQNENGFPNGIKAGDTIGYRLFGNNSDCMFTIYARVGNSWIQIVDYGYGKSVKIPSNSTGLMIRVA